MPQTSNHRLGMLEQRMDALSALPDRVASLETQVLQFREETRGEFAAVRAEMRQGFDRLRDEMHSGDEEIRRELKAEMAQRFDRLREEIHVGDEETRRHARVLHEEVLARFALLDEHLTNAPATRGQRKPSTRRKR